MTYRVVWALFMACSYNLVTNPFAQAAILLITGHWRIAATWVGAWFAICLVAVMLKVRRNSRLPGLEDQQIVTAPDWLFVLGDEQQGWLPQWLVDKWPRWTPYWFIALSCCSWRNKLRNLPFVPALAWLHKPKGDLIEDNAVFAGVLIRTRQRGWMVEVEAFRGNWFLDVGPRLDQPASWGACSWAFRIAGRL